MTEKASLIGAFAKLSRGDEHLKALEGELGRMVETNAYRAVGKLEAQGAEYVVRAEFEDADFIRCALILGDAIQNFRSALDHAVCQLVVANGRQVSQQQFPIFISRPATDAERARWKRAVRNVHPDFLDSIEHVQPYHADDPSGTTLAILASLSNADKHRLVVPLATAITKEITETLRPVPHDMEVLGQVKVHIGQPLEHGTPILRFPVRVTGPDPHVEMQGDMPFDIAFGETVKVGIPGIQRVRDHVRYIVEAFQELLRQRDVLAE